MRFDGWILGLGTTSGTRLVVGHWPRSPLGAVSDVMVERPDGHRVLQLFVAGAWLGWDSALIVVNGSTDDVEVTLPAAPGVTTYRLLWDSAWERPRPAAPAQAPATVTVSGTSLRVYAATDVG